MEWLIILRNKMSDAEKIEKLLALVKRLRKFVGLFMHKEIDIILTEIKENK